MSAQRPITVLITGFGPFPGAPVNASAALVEEISPVLQRRFRTKLILTHVFPTEWEGAPQQLARLYERSQPNIAVHFGVSARAAAIVLERVATNICRPAPDARGQPPKSSCIDASGPELLHTSLPIERIVSRLGAAGVPFQCSEDAGGYLCNAILYRSLQLAAQSKEPAIAGFVHIPAEFTPQGKGRTSNKARLSWDEAARGGIEVLRTSINAYRRRRPG